MARLELRYNEQLAKTGDVVALIKKVDTNHDMDLDVTEIGELLVVCIFCNLLHFLQFIQLLRSTSPKIVTEPVACHPLIPPHTHTQLAGGQDVTLQDAQYVRTQLETMANASVHGAFNPTMTTNPHLVSKAIFDWWWHYHGNKRRIPRYTQPGESVAGWLSTLPRKPSQVRTRLMNAPLPGWPHMAARLLSSGGSVQQARIWA